MPKKEEAKKKSTTSKAKKATPKNKVAKKTTKPVDKKEQKKSTKKVGKNEPKIPKKDSNKGWSLSSIIVAALAIVVLIGGVALIVKNNSDDREDSSKSDVDDLGEISLSQALDNFVDAENYSQKVSAVIESEEIGYKSETKSEISYKNSEDFYTKVDGKMSQSDDEMFIKYEYFVKDNIEKMNIKKWPIEMEESLVDRWVLLDEGIDPNLASSTFAKEQGAKELLKNLKESDINIDQKTALENAKKEYDVKNEKVLIGGVVEPLLGTTEFLNIEKAILEIEIKNKKVYKVGLKIKDIETTNGEKINKLEIEYIIEGYGDQDLSEIIKETENAKTLDEISAEIDEQAYTSIEEEREIIGDKTTAILKTNFGDIKILTKPEAAPKTVDSFLVLSHRGKYDGTVFHRIVEDANFEVIQGGDFESGNGTGGESAYGIDLVDEIWKTEPTVGENGYEDYEFTDESLYQDFDPSTGLVKYKKGLIIMANAGPNTGGSQFFITLADTILAPSYTVFGVVDQSSFATLDKISQEVDPLDEDGEVVTDGSPSSELKIESVELVE